MKGNGELAAGRPESGGARRSRLQSVRPQRRAKVSGGMAAASYT